jgi:Protein of unknown function (DUF3592)
MDTADQLTQLQRTFVAPSPLSHSRPRAVQLTAAGRALVAIAMLCFAGAIAAGFGLSAEARRQAQDRQALVDSGVTTTGVVTRLRPNGEHWREVEYRFVVGGRAYEGDGRVSSEVRRALQVGTLISVRYVPVDPDVHDLGGTPDRGLPIWVPFGVAAAIAAAGVVCLLVLNQQRQLLIDGRAAPAIVTGIKKHHSSHGGTHRSMSYQFRLLSGSIGSGKAGTSRKPPAVGGVICIVYDPDRPSRSMVYPFGLVTPSK